MTSQGRACRSGKALFHPSAAERARFSPVIAEEPRRKCSAGVLLSGVNYNLTSSQLTGKIRTGQIALARHIAMYLIRIKLDVPLKKIGDMFGGKDHTTVMSGISKVEKELKTNDTLKAAVEELEKRLKA